jgi:ElaB/YqjD/DUF883 family membrane-anchored ribosome-binding protein
MSDATKELPDSIEVIEGEIEQTREGLADKLEALTQQLTGTVEDVGETVEAVVETTKDTISNIKEAFNIPKQVEEHPWLAMGASILVGFIGGKILSSMTSGSDRHHGSHTNGWAGPMPQGMSSASAIPMERQTYEEPREQTQEESSGWLSGLKEQFSSELNKAKGLAVGTMFGVVRDMVSQALPETLKTQVAGMFDSVTEKLGGEPIQQGSLAQEPNGSASQQGSGTGSSSRSNLSA